MDIISIKDINLSKIIISKYGDHYSQKVDEILTNKNGDIEKFGYCLWAHSKSLQNKHTVSFCDDNDNDDIYVIFPYTKSNPRNNKSKKTGEFKNDILFTRYTTLEGKISKIPTGMSEVRGAKGSNAFYIEKLFYLQESIDFDEFYNFYIAENASGKKNEASKTLKSQCSNKCISMKCGMTKNDLLSKNEVFNSDNLQNNILVAKLKAPYQVVLS